MTKDEFGDRMKMYEGVESQRRHMPGVPVLARLDGRCFSILTRGLGRPYDPRFANAMLDMTTALVEQTSARVGYTQSDEVTLLWHEDHMPFWASPRVFYAGRIQKMTSILAAMATGRFMRALEVYGLRECADRYPQFDCRTWTVPTREEAANVFLWRELDASKNSVSMAARVEFSHSQLHKKSGQQMKEMLQERGINWHFYPARFKRGAYVQRRKRWLKYSADEIARLPPKHMARTNPDLLVERSEVTSLNLAPLRDVPNRVEVLFDGADPTSVVRGT